MIAGDVLIILFIWVWVSVYEDIVGAALSIPEKDEENKEGIETAEKVVGWVLFGYKCLFTLPFIIFIITEICFVCFLRNRIKYFDTYAQYHARLFQSSQNAQANLV